MRRAIVSILAILAFISTGGSAQADQVVYAVGDNCTILQLVGGQWVTVDPGDISGCDAFLDIWGSSSEDVYITGSSTRVMHFDGSSWQNITMPDNNGCPDYSYSGVDGIGPDNIFIGGTESLFLDYYTAVVYYYNGSSWTAIPDAPPGAVLRVSADPGGGFYAIGANPDPVYPYPVLPILYGYTDGAWYSERNPLSYEYDKYYDFGGFGADLHVVVGWAGTGPVTGGLILKRNESGYWANIPEDGECSLYDPCPVWTTPWYGVWCVSESDIWVCGASGRVVHWTPEGYTDYDTGATVALRALWGSSNSDIYAAGDGGTIVHFDGGTWSTMPSPTGENLTALWGLSAPTTDAGSDPIPQASFALVLNHPNPFNPTTTLTYSVPEHGLTTLRIYDVSGRPVKTILSEVKEPGTYSVQWNGLNDGGRQVASGIYLCRLTAGAQTASRKLVLLR
jgi:hypothetical protein